MFQLTHELEKPVSMTVAQLDEVLINAKAWRDQHKNIDPRSVDQCIDDRLCAIMYHLQWWKNRLALSEFIESHPTFIDVVIDAERYLREPLFTREGGQL